MEGVDERHEVVRRAVAGGGREVAGGLVAPRAVERMLGDRQQLDVGEAHVAGIGGQQRRHLAVGEEARGIVARDASTSRGGPRRSRAARRAAGERRAPPSTRRPATRATDCQTTRRGVRRHLGVEREGIALVDPIAVVPRDDVVLVASARTRRRVARPTRCPTRRAVASASARRSQSLKSPITETPFGVRAPTPRRWSAAARRRPMRARRASREPRVAPLVEQVAIEIGERRIGCARAASGVRHPRLLSRIRLPASGPIASRTFHASRSGAAHPDGFARSSCSPPDRSRSLSRRPARASRAPGCAPSRAGC